MNRAERRKLASGKGPKQTPRGTRRTIDFTPVANVPYEEHPKTAYCGFMLEALKPNEEARRLTPLQAMVATHYQGGEFDHIETQDDAQNVGDGLFTFCVNEAGDAGDKAEFINMLNRAIEQLRSLVGELEAVDGRIGEGAAAA